MKSNLKAFTLVETLVAIAVLMIAISTPYFASERALVTSFIARDKLSASLLAQEGLEYVHAARDSAYVDTIKTSDTINWFDCFRSGGTCPSGFSFASDGNVNNTCFTKSCYVDMRSQTAGPCANALCTDKPLHQGDTYSQTVNSDPTSKFSRAINITSVPGNPNEVNVTSTVTWRTDGVQYQVQASEYLDNWLSATAP